MSIFDHYRAYLANVRNSPVTPLTFEQWVEHNQAIVDAEQRANEKLLGLVPDADEAVEDPESESDPNPLLTAMLEHMSRPLTETELAPSPWVGGFVEPAEDLVPESAKRHVVTDFDPEEDVEEEESYEDHIARCAAFGIIPMTPDEFTDPLHGGWQPTPLVPAEPMSFEPEPTVENHTLSPLVASLQTGDDVVVLLEGGTELHGSVTVLSEAMMTLRVDAEGPQDQNGSPEHYIDFVIQRSRVLAVGQAVSV